MRQPDPSRFLLLIKPECWELAQGAGLFPAIEHFEKEYGVFEEMSMTQDELEYKLRNYFHEEEFYLPSLEQIRGLALRIRDE
jgi:hypothetical protein